MKIQRAGLNLELGTWNLELLKAGRFKPGA
jgi:hypothetical protein